ncbi:MAG: bifunctional riboflavin kinase/FAD synthetase [Clostridia bacterium]|nr:bifunctional riboflavin kinase/FAD synthetase [Clostridia bacterium]
MSVLILGTFDGVHKAHRALIQAAKEMGDRVIACTFDSPPFLYFSKDGKILTTEDEKKQLLEKNGVEVFLQSFDERIANQTPEEYVLELVEKFSPSAIVCGFNHKFGKNAAGNYSTLLELGKKYNFKVRAIPPVYSEGTLVSSTNVRNAILSGEIEKAKEMLGYNYFLSGTVVHGFGLGEKMGFQTANLSFDERKALLPKGVYATRVYFEGRKYKGMTNIGVNPTVQSANKLSVETHILGFSQNIYGKEIKIEFLKKIRAEQKFASKEELINQLSTDALLINGYIDSLDR